MPILCKNLITQFSDFLASHSLVKVPLLLGLSGGSDSTALFHLLLASKHQFEVAHLDHGWREGSEKCAAYLRQICQEKGVKYHCKSLKLKGSNLEDLSRQARLNFFQEVCRLRKLQGVLLAHHADDQAETVLKRVLEGASLPKLRGLRPKTTIGELTLYRPLLNIRKQDILQWLEKQGFFYYDDPTNDDTHFLRNRMRKTLLPTLSQHFGKQVHSSLCRLGKLAEELGDFLQEAIKPFRDQIIEGEEDISINFNHFPRQSPFIYKAIIRELFEKQKMALSEPILNSILSHLLKNSAHKTLQIGQKIVKIDRGTLKVKKLKLLSL